jgi:hypothetical protein
MRQQLRDRVRAVTHGQTIHARGDRHRHVEGSVANHQRLRCGNFGVFENFVQHLRIGLRARFIGAAARDKQRADAGLFKDTIKPAARLAGRHGQQITLRAQIKQGLAHAGKQRHGSVVQMKEIFAVTVRHFLA